MAKPSEILAGRNAVREALLAGRRKFQRVCVAEGLEPRGVAEELSRLCAEAHVPLVTVRREELEKLGEIHHQGVVAYVSPYPYASLDTMLALAAERAEQPFLLILDSLQDPQNVGSLLRTAEAVGVHGVVVPSHRAVDVTPAVSRASAGAVEHMQVAIVTNLAATFEELKRAGLWIVGVEDHPAAEDYRKAALDMPLALVLGSEGFGLRRLLREQCDLLVRIPMRGHIHSLNVAVAGSLLLYQAWDARQANKR